MSFTDLGKALENLHEGRQLQAEVQTMLDESVGGTVMMTKAKNRGAETPDLDPTEKLSGTLQVFHEVIENPVH